MVMEKAETKGATRVSRQLPSYRRSLAGRLTAAREAVMGPLRPILRRAGITEQQWRVLRVLIDQGAVDVSTVGAGALLRAPSVTRILRELQARGWVTREPDPQDARRAIVTISPTGRELVAETTAITLRMLDRYAEAFGVDRLQALIDELGLLIETLASPDDLFAEE